MAKGLIQFKVDGERYKAKGNFEYNLGYPKRTELMGSDEMHDFTEEPQSAFIKGEITDGPEVDIAALATLQGVTVSLFLDMTDTGPAKAIVLSNAYNAADGTGNSKEGNIPVEFKSSQRGKEVRP